MAILLIKGGNISLTKTDPSLKNIIIGLGWDVRETDSESFDLDTSILMIQSDGKARSDRDFIYYHQQDSACGAVHHTGDNRTGSGDGDDESIHVFLDKVPAEIHKLIVCVSIYEADKKKQNFGQVLSAFIRLVTEQPPAQAGGFELRTGSPDTRRLNDASYGGSILNSSFGLGSK